MSSLVQHAGHKGGQSEIDHAFDRHHVNHRPRLRLLRAGQMHRQAAGQQQQTEHQDQAKPGHLSPREATLWKQQSAPFARW